MIEVLYWTWASIFMLSAVALWSLWGLLAFYNVVAFEYKWADVNWLFFLFTLFCGPIVWFYMIGFTILWLQKRWIARLKNM